MKRVLLWAAVVCSTLAYGQDAVSPALPAQVAGKDSAGNAHVIKTDTSGYIAQPTGANLHMTCDSGCSSSAGFSDSSAFTVGTTAINNVGGLFNDSATALTSGQAGVARLTNNRAIHFNLRNAAGTEMGTAANPLQITGANGTFPVTGTFWQATQPVSGTVTTTPPANASTNISQVGGTAVVADPCQSSAKLYVSINQTANAQLVTGTAAKKIYPCDIHLVTATAQNVALVEGTGSTCGTGTSGVLGFGGATAATGWNLAANGGLTLGNGGYAVGQEGVAADNLCLFQSSTGQVSGGLSYVVQ